MTTFPIQRLTRLLQSLELSWLLPNLRQDLFVWTSLTDDDFLDKFAQLHPSLSDFSADDFSPARLALIALGQPGSYGSDTKRFIEAADDQLLQMAIRSFNDQTLFQADQSNLAIAGLIALALAYKYQATQTWNGLVDTIQERPVETWSSPLACLYGFVEDAPALLKALLQPECSPARIQLVVHMLLSNPLPPDEQITILLDLCRGPYGDLLPPRERLLLIKVLFEQRPQSAKDFCLRWLEVYPPGHKTSDLTRQAPDQLHQLADTFFNLEVNKIAGRQDVLPRLLAYENEVAGHLPSLISNHYLSQLSAFQSLHAFAGELSAANDQMLNFAKQNVSQGILTSDRAESALILAGQGMIDEASQLLPAHQEPLPENPFVLYAIAKFAAQAGDLQYATHITSRILEIIKQPNADCEFPVWGETFSLVNLGHLLLEINEPEQASFIFKLASQRCPDDASILKSVAESNSLAHMEQAAANAWMELVSLYPENLDYHRSLASSLESIEAWDAGLSERTHIIESSRSQSITLPKTDIYAYASCALNANHPELTLIACADLLSQQQEDCQALIYSGKAYLQMDDTGKGMEFLVRSTQVSPEIADGWLALADAQKKIYPLKTVIETLNTASQSIPDSAPIHYELGQLYVLDESPSLALPELESAASLSPESPKILIMYGQVLKSLGHIEESLDVLSKAYRLEPGYPGLAQLFARLLVDTGRLEEAIAPLELVINSALSQDPSPYMDYARCILSLNKLGECKIPPMKALIALNQVLQINPDFAEAKALIAESLAANGDHEMAFQAYREALDSELIDDSQWLERLSFGFGCVALSINKPDVAIAALQEANQINPTNPAILKTLTDAYLAANLPEEALRSARNVLAIDGDSPDDLAWFASKAEYLILKGKSDSSNPPVAMLKTVPDEALNILAKAIQLAPTRTDLLVQLGQFQSTIGALSESQHTFSSIASMDFAAIDDLKTSAKHLSSIGDHQSAIDCLENAITQDQKISDRHDPSLYIRLAEEYVKNNDHSSAIDTLDKAIALIPGDSLLITQKINLQLDLNQPIEALNCIEAAIKTATDGKSLIDLLFQASWISRATGDISGAINYLVKGISACRSVSTCELSAGLPAPYRALVADIYRALSQPDQSYKLVQAAPATAESDFSTRQSYLDFICLHTELALETGNQVRSEFQDLQLETTDAYFPRLMAIKARLMNKAGNYKQAEQILQLASKSISNLDAPGNIPAWSLAYTRYLSLVSIVEAGLDLGMWDIVADNIQPVIGSSPEESWPYLNLAKAHVLKAEFYNLCEITQVSKHKPAPESISLEAYNECSHLFEQARSLVERYKPELANSGDEFVDDQITRWQARADIAFKQTRENGVHPCDVLSHFPTPGDAAAMIYHLHQLDLSDPESDSMNRIIKIARSYPRHPAVFLQVALALNDDNPEDAMKSLQSVLEHNPYSKGPMIAFCNILLARISAGRGEIELAQKAIESALETWRDEPNWHALAAQIYKRNSEVNGAISHLLEATKLAPKNVAFHVELGKVYYEYSNDDTRMLKQALKSLETALGIDPKNVSTLILLATTQCLLNDPARAEANAREALLLAPNRADLYQLLGEIAIRSNDFQGAYEYANKALLLSPSDIQSTIILARSLAALNRQQEALAKLDAVLPSCSDEITIHLERVNILRKVNGSKAGLNELKILVSTYPDDFSLLNALAKSYLEVGESENAVVIARQALHVRTEKSSRNEQANLHLLIGRVLRQSGQLDPSISSLEDAIQLAPDRLEPYLELGLARKERREYQQALQVFEQATSIDPDDPRAPFQAGLALKESKDYKSSETMLRRAVSLAPNDLNIRRQLAAVVALNLVHNPHSGRN